MKKAPAAGYAAGACPKPVESMRAPSVVRAHRPVFCPSHPSDGGSFQAVPCILHRTDAIPVPGTARPLRGERTRHVPVPAKCPGEPGASGSQRPLRANTAFHFVQGKRKPVR